MTTNTVLTYEQRQALIEAHQGLSISFRRIIHDIEQSVLQSEQVQAWKRDAEYFRKMASYVYEIKRTHSQDEDNRVCHLQIDLRNYTPSPKQWLADAVDDFDATKEQQT